MLYGWAGKILRIDLSKRKISKNPLSKHLAERFLGGRGVNMKILYDEAQPNVDPYDPENPLVFGSGPLAGTLAPTSSRYNVSARRSPASMTFGDSNSAGHWSPELKFAGYDHIVITGRAKNPVYLWINDDAVDIRDASNLWGKTTWETDAAIKKDLADPMIQVACIGPAGENKVRFAAIINNLTRAAAHTGMGAVMGSKNLKAIAVRGSKGIKIAKPEKLEKAVENALDVIKKDVIYPTWSTYGTPILATWSNPGGYFTTRNSQSGWFEKADELKVEVISPKYFAKNKGCFNCPISCSHFCVVKDGPFKDLRAEGLEYNTTFEFGPNIGNSYWPAILKANTLCNQYGLDTDGTGIAIAFAMECYEKGIITEKDTDGLALKWGNYEDAMALIDKIAKREGIGNTLAEGTKIAAEKIGKGAEACARYIKNMDLNGDLRGRKGYALAYAVSTRGPDHLRGATNIEYFYGLFPAEQAIKLYGTEKVLKPREHEGKPRAVVYAEHLCAIADSVEICKFSTAWLSPTLLGFDEIAQMLSAATGISFNGKDLWTTGERIYNLERAMNAVDGISRRDDWLPKRQFEPMPNGPVKGERIDPDLFNKMLDEYYELRGWDKKTGIPTAGKLEALGLKEVANQLDSKKRGKIKH